ncbi:hypothetical protein ACP70R_033230 [Stipagrostis hirtigluma subsp. patula]
MTDLDGNIVAVPNPSGRGPGRRGFPCGPMGRQRETISLISEDHRRGRPAR